MKLRELINRLEEISENKKRDNFPVTCGDNPFGDEIYDITCEDKYIVLL